MKTRKTKSKMETRAFNACQDIKAYGSATIRVDWRKSKTWGMCPRIDWHGEKAAYAGGCGYNKESAVLAEFLQWLAPDPWIIGQHYGAGLRAVQDELAKLGWTLTQVYSGNREDGYRIERTED